MQLYKIYPTPTGASPVTEEEWLKCTDPRVMLESIQAKASPRKMRLFLVACARLVWDQIPDTKWKECVEVSERYADGLATEEDRDKAKSLMWRVFCENSSQDRQLRERGEREAWAKSHAVKLVALLCAVTGYRTYLMAQVTTLGAWKLGLPAIGMDQPRLLRDIFGLQPFHPITLNPSWLTSSVSALAHSIYNERACDRLPILADALEDAGCDSQDILNHLRVPGNHVRGCWVVDLLTGRE